MAKVKFAYTARIVLILLIAAAIMAACGRSTPKPATTSPSAETGASTATQSPAETQSDAEPGLPSRTSPPQRETNTVEAIDTREPTLTNTPEDTATPEPEYIFPTDEFGYPMYPVDDNGLQFFPLDRNGNPIIATDEIGYPVFPYDEEGMPIIPTDRAGKPMFEVDEFGNPIVPDIVFEEETLLDEEDLEPTETVRPGTLRATPSPRPRQQLGTPEEPGREPEVRELGGTATPIVWATPATTKPLGDPENPLIMAVQAAPGDAVAVEAMTTLADRIGADTGFSIRVQPVSSAAQLLNGMRANAVHLAWLQPFTYIIAKQRGYANVALVTNHFGVTAYGTLFFAAELSEFETYFDPTNNRSTGTAEEALAQFEGLRPCYVDPLSASGYIVPEGVLQSENISRQPPVFVLSHTAVIRALYVQGICDYGATFGISGDPRTASTIQTDLTDVMTRVPIIWRSDPVIPNLNLSIHSKVPEAVRLDLIDAFIDLAQTDDGKNMLTYATAYDIQGFEKVDDSFYDQLRKYLNLSGVNIRNLLGK